MKAIKVGSGRPACVALVLLTLVVTCTAWAQKVKDANQNLDNLAFSRPMLRLSETLSDSETLADRLENISDMDRFRSEYGTAWRFLIDERTGRVNLLEGGAIPFIPGPANDLRWENFAEASCQSQWCIPLPKIEGLARDFLAKHQGIQSLGYVMSTGLATCMIAGLTFLPALLGLLTRHGPSTNRPSADNAQSTLGREEPRSKTSSQSPE